MNNKRINFTVILILFAAALLIYFSLVKRPANRQTQMSEKIHSYGQDITVKREAKKACAMLDRVYQMHRKGKFSLEKAKQIAAGKLRALRYGAKKDGYFWADTVDGTNIVLYGNKEAEGKNRFESQIKDIKYVREIISAGLQGGGYTEYWFPKMGEKEPSPKRSYSVLYKPFGWVIGTGYYLEETRKENLLSKTRDRLYSKLARIDAALLSCSKKLADPKAKQADARKILRFLADQNWPFALDYALVDSRGKIIMFEPEKLKQAEENLSSLSVQSKRLSKMSRPAMSGLVKTADGLGLINLLRPIKRGGELLGSISVRIDPALLAKEVSLPAPYRLWIMQKDGVIIFDSENDQTGNNLLKDKLYKAYPNLVALGKKIIKNNSGKESYIIAGKGLKQKAQKTATWNTLEFYGVEWRVVIHRTIFSK